MESDLLMKEDEFYKENEKLEQRTKQLMQKVNDVMKLQDNLIKDTFRTQSEISNVRKNTYNSYKFPKKSSEDETLFDREFASLEENRTHEEGGGGGGFNSGLCRVYKAKLKSLIAEKERGQIELRQKSDEVKRLLKENQQFKEEKEKWFLSYNAGKNTIGKLESQVTNLNARLQSKDTENVVLKKEVEGLRKELKNCNLNFNNCDVRLTRACEEAEKFKSALRQCKEEEKELKDGYRKQVNELTATIKKIEKQKVELLNGFKKQMQLIDVLKKEKTHLEAYKICEMTEAEYTKILEWKVE